MMNDFALWNLDSRPMGAAIGDVDARLYNWNNGGWDLTSDPIYGTHIKPFISPYTSVSVCSSYTQITIPAVSLSVAKGPCVLLFDISNTGAPVAADLIGNPFFAFGPYPTRSSFGFR